jgi:hypothetical protein
MDTEVVVARMGPGQLEVQSSVTMLSHCIDMRKVRLSTVIVSISKSGTVKPLLTHTPQWTAQAMGYQGLWVVRVTPKIDLKNCEKSWKTQEKSTHRCGQI